jgi:TIR domain
MRGLADRGVGPNPIHIAVGQPAHRWKPRLSRGFALSDQIICTQLPHYRTARELAQPRNFYSVFISHSHKNKEVARRLNNALDERGVRCWRDEHQILPGDDIYEEVSKGIGQWDKVLLCCSEASLTSWWVNSEIDAAFRKEQELMKKRGKKILTLIPLDLDGYLFNTWESGKAREVKSRLAADFCGWEDDGAKFEEALDKVIKALHVGEDRREAPPESRL